MTANDLDLLRQFTRDHAQDAFTELVRRQVSLVYSAALRQVRSPQLAEEVAQSVFADLARDAAKLQPDTVLTAWLYAVTRRTAVDVIRKESRRQLREQIAVEMNAMNPDTPAGDWSRIAPLLDDAMSALDETDRTALLLRYFENKSLREVGQTLGISDDAAQKRVSRAVERLREYFSRRNVTIGASGLVVLISANSVQAAPVSLAVAISAAALAGATFATTATKTILMTTLQKTLVTATVAVLAGAGIYEAWQAARLHDQVEPLQQQQAALVEQNRQLQRERDDATNKVVALKDGIAKVKRNDLELLKLRGQAGLFHSAQQENVRLMAEKEALSQRLMAAESDAAVTRSNREQRILQIKKNLARDLAMSIQIFWSHHQRRMPATIAEALAEVDLQLETRTAAETNGISANQFELVANEIPLASENLITLMLREKEPFRQYDGTWIRVYANTATGTDTPTSTNGDFTMWEREHWSKRARLE